MAGKDTKGPERVTEFTAAASAPRRSRRGWRRLVLREERAPSCQRDRTTHITYSKSLISIVGEAATTNLVDKQEKVPVTGVQVCLGRSMSYIGRCVSERAVTFNPEGADLFKVVTVEVGVYPEEPTADCLNRLAEVARKWYTFKPEGVEMRQEVPNQVSNNLPILLGNTVSSSRRP